MSEHHFIDSRELLLALSESDLQTIKTKDYLLRIYHPMWSRNGLLGVLIGKNPPKKTDPRVRKMIREGFEFAPFHLTDAIIHEIEFGDTNPCVDYGPFRVTAYSESKFAKRKEGE